MPQLILLSSRPDDRAFAEQLAESPGWDLHVPDGLSLLKAHLAAPDSALVLFDAVDGMAAGGDWEEIRNSLASRLPPHQVIALSDEAYGNDKITFGGEAFFSHLWVRSSAGKPQGARFGRQLAQAIFDPAVRIDRFFKEGAAHQEITLRASGHRVAATHAVQNFFEKLGVAGRLAGRLAVAADELISNAIFNGPDSSARRSMDRAGEFALPPNETVKLGVYSDDEWAALYVADGFGTFRTETLFRIFAKNFRDSNYAPQSNRPSAGIGLRGLMDQGLSLIYFVTPQRQTMAAAFFPSDASMKSLKEGRQFISYLLR